MERSGLLSAWWMPREEEVLWEMQMATAPQKIMFLTGIFVIMNSVSHSLVRMFFDRRTFTPADHLWMPHRIVDFLYSSFSFLYSLGLFFGWAEDDNSFLQGRVFAVSPHQELLANIQSAYSLYSIGISVLNFKAFTWERAGLIMARGGFTLGMNYLYLLCPCVLGARLRVYWSVMEVAISVGIVAEMAKFLNVKLKSIILATMASLVLLLIRFWLTLTTLMWAYVWVSSENVWNGVPSDVPVSKLTSAYLTVTGIGAIGLSYLRFTDFRQVIQKTKEWSEKWQKKIPESKPASS